jgi:hypothetical protein
MPWIIENLLTTYIRKNPLAIAWSFISQASHFSSGSRIRIGVIEGEPRSIDVVPDKTHVLVDPEDCGVFIPAGVEEVCRYSIDLTSIQRSKFQSLAISDVNHAHDNGGFPGPLEPLYRTIDCAAVPANPTKAR